MPLNLSTKRASDSGNNSPAIGGNNSTIDELDPIAWTKSRSPARRIPMSGSGSLLASLNTRVMGPAKRLLTRTVQPTMIHRRRELLARENKTTNTASPMPAEMQMSVLGEFENNCHILSIPEAD